MLHVQVLLGIFVRSPEHDITPELRAEDSEARDARLPKKALFSQVGRLTRSVPTVRHGGVERRWFASVLALAHATNQ